MIRTVKLVAIAAPALMLTLGCAAAPDRSTPSGSRPFQAPGDQEERSRSMDVSNRFADLDAYLAFLEKRSHLGGAWYREVAPGVYRHETGNLRREGGQQARTFTRAELEAMFGFAQGAAARKQP